MEGVEGIEGVVAFFPIFRAIIEEFLQLNTQTKVDLLLNLLTTNAKLISAKSKNLQNVSNPLLYSQRHEIENQINQSPYQGGLGELRV